MFKIDPTKEHCQLIVTCDLCGRQIDNFARALFTWREVTLGTNDRIPDSIKNESTEVLVDDGKIFTLHKGECRQLFEALNGGESCHWPWQEMKELPFELMVNIGLPVENVQKQFKDYRESGYID